MRRIEKLFEPEAIDSYVTKANENGEGNVNILIKAHYKWSGASDIATYYCEMFLETGKISTELYSNPCQRSSNNSQVFKNIYKADREILDNAIELANVLQENKLEVAINGMAVSDAEHAIGLYDAHIRDLKAGDHTMYDALEISDEILKVKGSLVNFTKTVRVKNLDTDEIKELPVEYLLDRTGEKFEGVSEQDQKNPQSD